MSLVMTHRGRRTSFSLTIKRKATTASNQVSARPPTVHTGGLQAEISSDKVRRRFASATRARAAAARMEQALR